MEAKVRNSQEISIMTDRVARQSVDDPSLGKSPGFADEPIIITPSYKTKLSLILNHWLFTIWMTILTVYALFGEDIRVSAFSKSADTTFYSLTIVCLAFFSIEIIMSLICKEDYFLSFYFWLDLISTVTLITDIGWAWSAMIGQDSSGSSNAAKAGAASKAGARAARIIRIVRVIRLVRIVKLYKFAVLFKSKKKKAAKLVRGITNFRNQEIKKVPIQILPEVPVPPEESANGSISYSFGDTNNNAIAESPGKIQFSERQLEENELRKKKSLQEESHEQSKLGKYLTEVTTQRVILLVLGILFGVPIFYSSLYSDYNTSYEYGLAVMDKLVANNTNFRRSWDSYVDEHKNLDNPLIYVDVGSMGTWESSTQPSDLRDTELLYVVLPGKNSDYEFYSFSIFDMRQSTKMDAELNICKTIFICFLLTAASIFMSRDTQKLALDPIEGMIEMVKKIAKNPLLAAQEEERKEVELEVSKANSFVSQKTSEFRLKSIYLAKKKKREKENEALETFFLQKTLIKIGALLALGFGEAGSEIIATNMQKGGGEVDPMIPGKKTHCIFGFCDIRDFADATEVLQQEVLVFVNEVAHIVHKTVDYFSGCANKNIGDAFLLVWKFPDFALQISDDGKNISLSKDMFVQQLADMSVLSFMKIIAEIHKNHKILSYRSHEKLISKIPGFSVKMGFGLHQGWAIEGAIGSEFKIDASYLSPNVNMASRLEAATKQFGVHILISSVLYNICSSVTKTKLRRVDRVTVKGSRFPLDLYTCDVFPKKLIPGPEEISKSNTKKARVLGRIARDKLKENVMAGDFNISDLWDDDDDLALMRTGVSKEFIKEYSIALQDYLDGKWTEAKAGFLKAQALKGGYDGPCQVLLEFINSEGGVAPANWPGHRELHDK